MGGPGKATNLLSKPASPVAPPVDNCLTGRTAGLWRVAAHLPLSGGSWLKGAAQGFDGIADGIRLGRRVVRPGRRTPPGTSR